MTPSTLELDARPTSSPTRTGLHWLYVLFFLSGISGLMYEVVWVRMLGRLLGSTVYATSTVLAVFMGGLALGSFLIGRFVDRSRRPLRLYALLELAIGVSALASLAWPELMLPLYQAIYDASGGSRAWLTAGQVLITMPVLLVPTTLMGATLPVLCAHGARQHADFARCAGSLYGINTLGAVLGVLASGFVLLGEVGETFTLLCGVVLNLVVAAAAWGFGARALAPVAAASGPQEEQPEDGYPARVCRAVVVLFAVSGFVALASEVIWSRMLLLYQGTSIYAFSAMLAVVLAGMGLGSFAGGSLMHWCHDPLLLLARLQLGIGLAQVAALHLYARQQADLVWPAVVLLGPLGLLWGLTFPAATACYARTRAQAGRRVGELYAWNTVGCIAGSLAAGFVLLPLLGSSPSLRALAVLSLLGGLALLAVHPQGIRLPARLSEALLAAAGVVLLATAGDPYFTVLERKMRDFYSDLLEAKTSDPYARLLGRSTPVRYAGALTIYRHVEEAAGTTTAFGADPFDPRARQLWINGCGMTSMSTVTKLMAHLPIALADDPRDVLVVCFGMGTTVRSASRHEGLQIHAVEMVPAVVECFGYYHADGPEILQRDKVHVAIDDGRNYLQMRPQQYDVITIDPAPPLHSAGTVNLYSWEFFQLCRQRLRPAGVVCLWIPPVSYSEVKMLLRTYLDVFPFVSAWSGTKAHPGFLLMGSHRPLQGVPEKIRQLYRKPAVVADLTEWDQDHDQPEKLLALHVTEGPGLVPLIAGARIVTDDCPYTEFPLWRSRVRDGEYYQVIDPDAYRESLRAGR